MWDFQYSRIWMRMRILHFNIRGYRMRILYILLLILPYPWQGHTVTCHSSKLSWWHQCAVRHWHTILLKI